LRSCADIDAAQIAASAIVYLEGYLWDPKSAKEAFVKASTIAHEAGRQVALTLSDSFCVGRYRGEFLDLMRNGTVDLVFANEAELGSLYETADFDAALKQLRSDTKLGVVTRSEKGCVVASTEGVTAVPAFPVSKIVDTTGAGDLFAAGFLFGLVRGAGYEAAGRLGALAAAEVIQHIGARPQDLAEGIGAEERVAGLGLSDKRGNAKEEKVAQLFTKIQAVNDSALA
jgi:sugar/nucleoside kinase (ribokinase family)